MSKEIAYLVQTPDYIPEYVKVLENMGRDVYILSWKEEVEYKNSIFFPESTWTTGRNKLAEIVPKKYLYYVFLDDDVELYIRKEKYSKEKRNPWKIFDDFLLEYEPAIGSGYCSSAASNLPTYIDDTEEINTVREYEIIIAAIHNDVMSLYYPMFLGFDNISWNWGAALSTKITMFAFKSCILQCNKVAIFNRCSRKYRRFNLTNFFHRLYEGCFLTEMDKKEASLAVSLSWIFSSDGEYKKPYPGKYKKLAEDFKTKVNKNHIFWRDHPFINE